MQPNIIYVHDRHQLVVYHERSGYCAIAPRDMVLCARPDEVRTGFTTSFFTRITPALLHLPARRIGARWLINREDLLQRKTFEPRGEVRVDPCAEEVAWRDAVFTTLNNLLALGLDEHLADLRTMWRNP